MTAAVDVLFIALGAFVGAPARFLVDRYVTDRTQTSFPLGTLLINLSGSLLLGVLTGIELRGHLPAELTALLATGFCGAFTTFSTWSFETVRLIEQGETTHALTNALGSVVLGLLAAGAGLALVLSL
ncbi:MAG: fluoride efflux transporter CrcB [Actinomycetota bacterium]|nr:fluoride efflux transporter CrcB [Actinomycetota bacterium]